MFKDNTKKLQWLIQEKSLKGSIYVQDKHKINNGVKTKQLILRTLQFATLFYLEPHK